MMVLPYGESALLVNFEQRIDKAINQKVIRLKQALTGLECIHFTIPAYCSLTIGYHADLISREELKQFILEQPLDADRRTTPHPSYTIPVCYEGDFAPDMKEVSELTGLSQEEIVRLHTGTTYRVYMLGFIAGFAYLGRLPQALQCPRKKSPRKQVPEGAVGLAGFQTGIYPAQAPGGWQLIGQTPVKTFNPALEQPVLLEPGTSVQFRAIDVAEYESIKDGVRFGTYEWEVKHG